MTKTKTLLDRIKTILSDTLGVDESEVTPNASLVDDLGADSLDQVELVMAFEEEFELEISGEEGESLKTVQDILDFLGKKNIA